MPPRVQQAQEQRQDLKNQIREALNTLRDSPTNQLHERRYVGIRNAYVNTTRKIQVWRLQVVATYLLRVLQHPEERVYQRNIKREIHEEKVRREAERRRRNVGPDNGYIKGRIAALLDTLKDMNRMKSNTLKTLKRNYTTLRASIARAKLVAIHVVLKEMVTEIDWQRDARGRLVTINKDELTRRVRALMVDPDFDPIEEANILRPEDDEEEDDAPPEDAARPMVCNLTYYLADMGNERKTLYSYSMAAKSVAWHHLENTRDLVTHQNAWVAAAKQTNGEPHADVKQFLRALKRQLGAEGARQHITITAWQQGL